MNEQQRKAMELALEALEKLVNEWTKAFAEYEYDSDFPSENQYRDEVFAAITAIKEALAQDALQALHDENKSLGLYEKGYADAMNWKVQNHLEHLPAAQPEQGRPQNCGTSYCSCIECVMEPVAWPCVIEPADFEEDTVTLKMQSKDYSVGVGLHWLSTTPPQRKPVSHAVIAGALFDFMGWLTSRKERLALSSSDEASPAVDAIRDFAKMRGLSLDDAKVHDWHTTQYVATPRPQRTWVGLTDEEIDKLRCKTPPSSGVDFDLRCRGFARAIEAKLREKNSL